MEYADENYYRVYTFSEFSNETMEHLNDRWFLTLWRIYDEMLHDPIMEDKMKIIPVINEIFKEDYIDKTL